MKKYRKWKSKSCKDKKRKQNAFIKKYRKKSKFIKQQEVVNSLGIKTPLNKIPLLGPFLS